MTEEKQIITRRDFVIGGSMIAGGLLAFGATPAQPDRTGINFKTALPERFKDWRRIERRLDSIPQPSNYAQSIYEQVLIRHYKSASGQILTLLIAYNRAQSYRSQLHRPDICYPASGFSILSQKTISLPIGSGAKIPSQIIRTKRGKRHDTVLFWTRLGDKFPTTLFDQRLEIARSVFRRQRNDGVVLRVSMPSNPDKVDETTLLDFIELLMAEISNEMQALLLGPLSN